MPYTRKQIARINNVDGEPFLAGEHSLSMRTAESYIRRRLFALEDATINTLFNQWRNVYQGIRGYALNTAANRNLSTLAVTPDTLDWKREVLAQAKIRINYLMKDTANTVLDRATLAYALGYYGRAYVLDMATNDDVQIKIPRLENRGVTRRVIQPRMQEAVTPDSVTVNLLGDDWQDTYADIGDELLIKIRRAIDGGMANGDTVNSLLASLAGLMGVDRAQGGAFSKTNSVTRTNVLGAASSGSVDMFKANEVWVLGLMWVATANDNRTCFPAHTLVSTENGDKPIQHIKPGDKVMTRNGLRRVVATNKRPYGGSLVSIKSNTGTVISTADHQYWTLEKGWLQGGNIDTRNTLQSVNNQPVKVLSVLNFNLSQPNSYPPIFQKLQVLLGVLFGVTMPIRAINFKGNAKGIKQEVNTVASHFSLLNIGYFKRVKRLSYLFFEKCFPIKLSVARKATKLPINITGYNSESLIAIPTMSVMRWASAFFGTILSVLSSVNVEEFTASLTSDVFSSIPTFAATNGAFVCLRTGNRKGLAAFRTNLFNRFGFPVIIVAFSRAITSASLVGRWRHHSLFATSRAFHLNLFVLVFSIALTRTKSMFRLFCSWSVKDLPTLVTRSLHWYACQLITKVNTLYHVLTGIPIVVYDIEVEEEHEFFANGVLVHNCNICRGLHGTIWALGDPNIKIPPFDSHFGCRCSPMPVIIPGSKRDDEEPPPDIWDDWLDDLGELWWLRDALGRAQLDSSLLGGN